MHLNINDLLEQLRVCSYRNITDVEFAIFETSGSGIIPKSQCRPLRPRDLRIETQYRCAHPLLLTAMSIMRTWAKPA